jgi:Cu/Ag efflux pump CusA
VSRYVDVTANVSGRSIGAVEDEIRDGLKNLSFPIEYHAEVVTDKAGGFRDAPSRVLPYLIASAAGIFLLLQAAFGSWRLAAVAFFVIPSALVGGIIAVLITGGDLSIGSYLGFLVVLGISVRNGVALISRYLGLKQANAGNFGADLAVLGAGDRFAPVIMTALAGSLALLPVMFAGGRAGLEVIQPLAVVVLGGLVISTLIHLFVLPAACLRFWPSTARESTLSLHEPVLDLKG